MTEEEAKTKWCPMVQVQSAPYVPGTFSSGCDNRGALCIGSACMMWRDTTIPREDYPEVKTGYCGLAGKP